MILHVFLAAFVILVSLSDNAAAQGGPSPERALSVMDNDGDGKISADEWRGPPPAFARIDRDGDGYATAEELRTFMSGRFAGKRKKSKRFGGKFGNSGKRFGGPPARTRAEVTTGGFQIIDTHVHFGASRTERNFVAGASEATAKIQQRNIKTAILIPTPQVGFRSNSNRYDYLDLRKVINAEQYRFGGGPGMFGALLHGKSSVTDNEKAAFRSMAEKMVKDGIVVFGEIGLHHYGIPAIGNLYGAIPLDHPLLKVLGDVAANSGIPIDIHFDIVPEDRRLPPPLAGAGNPSFLEENLSAFEKFLSENRRAKIVWAHAGFEPAPFRSAEVNARLLRRHPNLFMSIRLMMGHPKPSAAMDSSEQLKSDWRELFIEYADRFVLGSESMYGSHMSSRFDNQFILYQKMLAALPPDVAKKIASENALRIYPLK